MNNNPLIRVLLIKNSAKYVNLIVEILQEQKDKFKLVIIESLKELLNDFSEVEFDIIILDLPNPDVDSSIIVFTKLYEKYPETPIITMTDFNEEIGQKTLEQGGKII